jgi:hypothetical protein
VTRDGADRLGGGARRQWRTEQMEKKMEKKGSEVGNRRLLKALGATWGQEKVHRGGRRSGRQRPSAVGRGQRRCGVTGEGGGVRLTRRDRLTGGAGRR